MSIIDNKYKLIAPLMKYLSNEVILAQAWKKTHSYIRRYNWYADVLELDCSTIDLENRLKKWAKDIKGKPYKVDAMRLVLAPKSKEWHFPEDDEVGPFDSWSPRTKDEGEGMEQELRPLAHLTLRDQTVSTAVMLCLADAVETAQGPTEESDFLSAQKKGIYSYGNRLHCQWNSYPDKRSKASFGWGNSRCYRQYYEDYKTFLKRPRNISQYYSSIISPYKNLYIVSLDLKGFFDHIDIRALVEELKRIYSNYYETYNLSKEYKDRNDFWEKVAEIFSWNWANEDLKQSEYMCTKKLPQGLPQGLVASGFLANAYLINFDKSVGEKINKDTGDKNIIIRDYCRYVDDIRLVIEMPSGTDSNQIKILIEKMVEDFLLKHQKEIRSNSKILLNKEKTKVISFEQVSTQNNISSLMNMYQGVLSGTPDSESLRQAVGGLDGLLGLSEQLENKDFNAKNSLDLSRISTPHIDVRNDTIKRFVATRMVKSLRLRRSMMDLNENLGEESNVTVGQMLDHEFETVARKLIACWASNPSLTLLLKCGLDLYPDPKLLAPIIDALKIKMYNIPSEDSALLREMKVAEYIMADLFKAAATDIGYRSETMYPSSADIKGFREELAVFARDIMTTHSDSPWYIQQQAILFLISVEDYGFSIDSEKEELKLYSLLLDASLYRSNIHANLLDLFTVSLVIQQINPNPKKFTYWFISWIQGLNSQERKEAIQGIFMNRPDLMKEIINSKKVRGTEWASDISDEIKQLSKIEGVRDLNSRSNEYISLSRVIQSDNNPFKQENALLLLMRLILTEPGAEQKLSQGVNLTDIYIKCKDWEQIQNPRQTKEFLEIKFERITVTKLNETPSWVKDEYKWMYSLGRILRSCITGEYDFTSHSFLMREDIGLYKGVKSTWYTRRFGLNNHPRGLLQEASPITPWLTELLIKLLQWPGIHQKGELVNDFGRFSQSSDLLRITQDRLNYQSKIFGRLSNTPFYILPAPTSKKNINGKLKIAIVQPLLPKVSDFNLKDPMHWTASYRAKHRNHIASICNLVNNQIKSTRSAFRTTNSNKKSGSEENIDLIVFPELTVHQDDIDLLRGLSDATGANIFAGLTFIKSNNFNKPINQALWLLRDERSTGRQFLYVYQGKQHMTKPEIKMGIQGYRPYQVIIEIGDGQKSKTRLAGAICYDATDLALVADLREISDIFVIAAMNKDIQTFDNMVAALHYHMFQPIVLANTGEFGGSTVQAPLAKHARQIAHVHGNNQVAVSIFEVDTSVFKGHEMHIPIVETKTKPAGFKGRE